MNDVIGVRCRCGDVRGELSALRSHTVNRIVCYCDDCRAFARHLGRDDVLDGNGGTEIFQVSSGCLRLHGDARNLACVRLTHRGLLRWYARCCHTPIGNTLPTAFVPFVGMIHACLDLPAHEPRRSEVAGPVRARVHGRHALGDPDSHRIHPRAPLSYLCRCLYMLAAARLRGDHRRSPLFDPVSGAARARPSVLAPQALRRLKALDR